ncbi:MAG: hypothetical protein ABWX82_00790 [Leifsonia sp.]
MTNDSSSTGPDDGIDRSETEGHYTETDGEGASVRQVHGQYTETEGDAPDPTIEGSYTDEEEPAQEEEGDFTRSDE